MGFLALCAALLCIFRRKCLTACSVEAVCALLGGHWSTNWPSWAILGALGPKSGPKCHSLVFNILKNKPVAQHGVAVAGNKSSFYVNFYDLIEHQNARNDKGNNEDFFIHRRSTLPLGIFSSDA